MVIVRMALVLSMLTACSFSGAAGSPDGAVDEPDAAPPDAAPPSGFKRVSVGYIHTCAIADDDTLWCWGDNSVGQLGLGETPIEVSVPTQVSTLAWRQVAAGITATCGITFDNALWCWGSNTKGLLGIGATDGTYFTPQRVDGAWRDISVGYVHACAISTTGQLSCWGANGSRAIGDGTTTDANRPVSVLTDKEWELVSAGYATTCAITTSRELWCWGLSNEGQVGRGIVSGDGQAPGRVGSEAWQSVDIYYATACGLLADGRARCWGYNAFATIGNGGRGREALPTRLFGTDDAWDEIRTGQWHTCGRRGTRLFCWGTNAFGALGATADVALTPTQVAPNIGAVKKLAEPLGTLSSCVLDASDRIACAGYDGYGNLGRGTGGAQSSPAAIAGSFTSLAAGSRSTCGVAPMRQRQCWGDNTYGLYGTNNTSPVQIPTATNTPSIDEIAVGQDFACERRDDNIWCTGYNAQRQVSASISSDSVLVAVRKSLPPLKSLSSRSHSCAVPSAEMGVYCWGPNDFGQLGNGTPSNRDNSHTFDTEVVDAVSVGLEHTCVLRATGAIDCVGRNSYGQLGDGTMIDRLVPVPVLGSYKRLASGGTHTCAIDASGQLWCWGNNSYGQLGVEGGDANPSPRLVNTAAWSQISAGLGHTCGIQVDGTLWCWGLNLRGAAGDGTFTNVASPTRIGALSDWLSVTTGDYHTCAISAGSGTFCWGGNGAGELGNGLAWSNTWQLAVP